MIIGTIKPCHLDDKDMDAPMHPIKLNAGEPINKVIIVGKIISLGRLTNIPKIGVKITIGRQLESQWEKLFAKEI